jgi:hypothetical protein
MTATTTTATAIAAITAKPQYKNIIEWGKPSYRKTTTYTNIATKSDIIAIIPVSLRKLKGVDDIPILHSLNLSSLLLTATT